MAITFVDDEIEAGSSKTSHTFSWTDFVGEATNDVVVVALYRESTAAYGATPSGWNQVAGFPQSVSTGGFKYQVDLWWRRVSGDSGTAVWSWTGAAWSSMLAMGFRGCTTSATPITGAALDTEAAQNDQPVHAGITVSLATSALGFFTFAFASNIDSGDPAGYTDPTSTGHEIHSYYKLTTAAGVTGTVSGNLADPEYSASILFELLAVVPSAAVTGTATASITEADVVAGGKTIITTLTDDTFVADTVPAAGFSSGTTIGTATAGGRAGDGTFAVTFFTPPTLGQFGIIICYLDAGTASINSPGSPAQVWNLVTGAPWGSSAPKLYIWTRVMVGGETEPTITIAGSAGTDSIVENTAFYDGIGSVVTIGAATTGTGTPSTAAQITGAAVGNIILGIIGRGDNEAASGQTFGGSSTGVNERLDGGTAAGNDSQISMADKTLTATGATGGFSATTAATDPYIGIILELGVATNSPYKVAAVNLWAPLLDSAQAEANGWDATVKPALVASNFVRTSATVTTITLPAVASYDITAQETITDTVPGGILTAASNIVATPTFTVDTSGGAAGQPARKRLGGVQFASVTQSGSVGVW